MHYLARHWDGALDVYDTCFGSRHKARTHFSMWTPINPLSRKWPFITTCRTTVSIGHQASPLAAHLLNLKTTIHAARSRERGITTKTTPIGPTTYPTPSSFLEHHSDPKVAMRMYPKKKRAVVKLVCSAENDGLRSKPAWRPCVPEVFIAFDVCAIHWG